LPEADTKVPSPYLESGVRNKPISAKFKQFFPGKIVISHLHLTLVQELE